VVEMEKEIIRNIVSILNNNGSITFYLYNARYTIEIKNNNYILKASGSNYIHIYKSIKDLFSNYLVYGESLIELLQDMIIVK
jgi:hypothetical protein